jgi:hypothetical protein
MEMDLAHGGEFPPDRSDDPIAGLRFGCVAIGDRMGVHRRRRQEVKLRELLPNAKELFFILRLQKQCHDLGHTEKRSLAVGLGLPATILPRNHRENASLHEA